MKLLSVDFWKSNTSYVASNRYKSFIVHNNILYICTESHTSGGSFDSDKFTSIGGAGGGLNVAGEWDIESSTSVGDIVSLPLSYDTYYDSTSIGGLNVLANTNSPPIYPFEGNYRVFGASSPVIELSNGMKWLNVNCEPTIFYGFILIYEDTYVDPANDLILGNLGSGNPNTNYALLGIVKVPNVYRVSLLDASGEHHFLNLDFDVNTTSISVGVDINDGYLTVTSGESSLSQNLNITGTNFKIGSFSVYGSFFNNELLSVSNGTPNFTYQGQEIIVVPPEGAVDGDTFQLISNGSYNNVDVNYGDYCIFYNGLANILPIKYYDTQILSLSNTVDAIDTYLNDTALSLLDRVVTRGIIDVISDTEPSAPFFGKTRIDLTDQYSLKAYDGTAWEIVEPNQFQKFLYGDTGLELYYNKVMAATRKVTQIPSGEVNNEYYDLLNDSNNWSGTEAKSCQYINLADLPDNTININLTDYTDVIIDASGALLSDYIATISSENVYESDTAYIKDHRIQLFSSSNYANIDFYYQNIAGLNSSTINIGPYEVIMLVLTPTTNFNKLTHLYGVKKYDYYKLSSFYGPNHVLGNVEDVVMDVDIETAFTFTSKVSDSFKCINVKYKNTAVSPDVSLSVTDKDNVTTVVAMPITGLSGSFTIARNPFTNTYEVF